MSERNVFDELIEETESVEPVDPPIASEPIKGNVFDELIDEERLETDQARKAQKRFAQFNVSAGITADKMAHAAEAFRLSEVTQLPIDYVNDNIEDVKRLAESQKLDLIDPERHPALIKYLQDPYSAALIKDEITEAGDLEQWFGRWGINKRLVEAVRGGTPGLLSYGGRIAKDILTGPDKVIQRALDNAQGKPLNPVLDVKPISWSPIVQESPSLAQKSWEQGVASTLLANKAMAARLRNEPLALDAETMDLIMRQQDLGAADRGLLLQMAAGVAGILPAQLQSIAAAVPASFAASRLAPPQAALGAAGVGAAAASYQTMANLEGGLAYWQMQLEAYRRGVKFDPYTAQTRADLIGAVNGALELVPETLLLKPFLDIPGFKKIFTGAVANEIESGVAAKAFGDVFPKVSITRATTKTLAQFGTALIGESLTEGVQAGVTEVGVESALGAMGAPTSYDHIPRVMAEEIQGAAIAFAPLMGIGAGGIIRAEQRRKRTALETSARLFSTAVHVRALKTAQTSPEQIKQLVGEMIQQNDVPPYVFHKRETWDKVMTAHGFDPREAARRMTGSDAAYDQAVEKNGDVAIPHKDWMVHIAPNEAISTPLMKDARFNPGDPYLSDYDKFSPDVEKLMEETVEEYGAPERAVYDSYIDQVPEHENITEEQKDHVARWFTSSIRVMSEKAGYTDPYQFMLDQQYELTINGEEQGAATLQQRRHWSTEEFQAFFAGTHEAVKDDAGNPRVFYRGAEKDRGPILGNPNQRGWVWATDHPGIASHYAFSKGIFGAPTPDFQPRSEGSAPNVLPLYIALKNPMVIDAAGAYWTSVPYQHPDDPAGVISQGSTDSVASIAERLGHDGLVIRNVVDPADEHDPVGREQATTVIAFQQARVKSAIGNTGQYDQSFMSVLWQGLRNPPNPELQAIADRYVEARGLEIRRDDFRTVDIGFAKRTALAYEKLPAVDYSPETKAAYEAFVEETQAQWEVLKAAGYKITAWNPDSHGGREQPYATSAEMAQDVRENKHLYYFTGGEEHPYMTPAQNELFRAVHDIMTHAQMGFQFGARGEFNAAAMHSQMYSPLARKAMLTETHGQNSWVNFGPHEPQKMMAKDRPYAPQKAALLPAEIRAEFEQRAAAWMDPFAPTTPAFSVAPPRPESTTAVIIHYSKTPGLRALDPQFAGTGTKFPGTTRRFGIGQYGKQGGTAARTYGYVWNQGQPLPAPNNVRGDNVYAAKLGNLYDARADVLGLKKAAGANEDKLEEMIHEAGFDGMVDRGSLGGDSAYVVVFSLGSGTTIPAIPLAEQAVRQQEEAQQLRLSQRWPSAWQFENLLTDTELNQLTEQTGARFATAFMRTPSADEVAAVAFFARAKRGWYKRASEAIKQIFGEDATRFAGLLAALSPQSDVETNLKHAAAVWANWVQAGRPTERSAILKIMGKSVQGRGTEKSVLEAWRNNSVEALTITDPEELILSGPKVHSFMLNNLGNAQEVTNDSWMALFFSLAKVKQLGGSKTKTGPGKSMTYLALSARVREAAQKLSAWTGEEWTPAEVQETVWSWTKTLFELAQGGEASAAEIVKSPSLLDAAIGATPEFGTMFTKGRVREALDAAGYGDKLAALAEPEKTESAPVTKGPSEERMAQHMARAAARLDRMREQRATEEPTLSLGQADRFDPDDLERGSISFTPGGRKFNIKLLKGANVSTLVHETSHFLINVLGDVAQLPTATDQAKSDYATLLKWMGYADHKERIEQQREAAKLSKIKNPTAAQANRLATLIEKEEKLARGFERYVMEGKTPRPELVTTFTLMRVWLTKIYRFADVLNVDLTDEVREVFDRMIASDQAIATAESETPYTPDAEAIARMTDAEREVYEAAATKAATQPQDELRARLISDKKDTLEKWFIDEKAALTAEIGRDIWDTQVYRALRFLQTGQMPPGVETPASLLGPGGKPHKINADSLRDALGKGSTWMRAAQRMRLYQASGGIDANEAASLFGFPSAQVMIEELALAPNFEATVAAAVDREIESRYPDLLRDQQALASEATLANLSDARAEQMMIEIRVLARIAKKDTNAEHLPVSNERMAAAAKLQMEERSQGEFTPHTYLQRMAAAGRDVLHLQTPSLRWDARVRQLWNFHLYKAAVKAQKEFDKQLAFMQEATTPRFQAKLGKAGDEMFRDPVNEILYRTRFKRESGAAARRRINLRQWVNDRVIESNGGLSSGDVVVSDWLMEEAFTTSYREMSLQQIREAADAVRSIANLARVQNSMVTAEGKRIHEDEVKPALIAQLQAAMVPAWAPGHDKNKITSARKAAQFVKRVGASLYKVEEIIRQMDGGAVNGPWATYVWNPIAAAQNAERDLTLKVTELLMKEMEKLPSMQRNRLNDLFLSKVTGEEYSYLFALSVALNSGNADNLQRLYNTPRSDPKWGPEAVNEILDQLTVEDMRFVQGVWDILETMWPEISALEKRATGLEPTKVDRVPFQFKGETFQGGYYPIKYDRTESSAGRRQADASQNTAVLFDNNYARAMTNHGHVMKRVNSFGDPIDLSIHVLPAHLQSVIHDLTHREALLSVHKILNDNDIYYEMTRHLGEAKASQFLDWLRGVANDQNQDLNALSWTGSLARGSRRHLSVVAMGFKATMFFQNFANIFSAMDQVKARHLADASKEYYTDRTTVQAMIHAKSPEMRHRFNQTERDIRDLVLSGIAGGKISKARVKIARAASYMTAVSDSAVAHPVWLGAYRQALEDKMSEADAVSFADRSVRLTLGGSGQKDLANIQRNNEFLKTFTMFYTFFSTQWNQLARITWDARTSSREKTLAQDWGMLLVRTFVTVAAQAMLAEYLSGRGPDDDEPFWKWSLRKAAMFPFLTVPIVRDAATRVESKLRGDYVRDIKFGQISAVEQEITDALIANYRWIAEDNEYDKYIVKRDVRALGYLLGLPTQQATITGEYLWDLADKSESPETPWELGRNLLFTRRKQK